MEKVPNEILLKTSRVKWILMLSIFVMFVAAGVFMLRSGEDRMMSWFCIGFFGLGIPLSLLQIIRPGTLFLHDDGFEQHMMGRTMACRWEDVSEFGIYKIKKGFFTTNTFVSFSRREDQGKRMAGLTRSLSGGTAQLGDTFGMKAQDLADIMNGFRARSLSR